MATIKTPKLECDRRTLVIVVILMAVGCILVASASSYFSAARFGDSYFLLKRHLLRMVIAGLFLVLAIHIDYRVFRRLSPVALAAGLALLLGLFIFGHAIRGPVRQFHLESLQMTFQPSEIARFSLVLFLAFWIARRGEELKRFKTGFLPAGLAVIFVLGLMAAQPSFGTAMATAVIALLMLYIGGARLSHLGTLVSAVGVITLIGIQTVGYIRERLVAHFNPGEGVCEMNWQLHQSLIALGTGGPFGLGLGASRQKLNWLPDSHTDFIFSILGEESGLLGTMLVSLLFLLLALRALKISRESNDRFGEMLVIGIGCTVFVYAILNMFVTTGLFPVTGLPLPFVSYGGSALVVNAFSIGVLLNVSKRHRALRTTRGRKRAV